MSSNPCSDDLANCRAKETR